MILSPNVCCYLFIFFLSVPYLQVTVSILHNIAVSLPYYILLSQVPLYYLHFVFPCVKQQYFTVHPTHTSLFPLFILSHLVLIKPSYFFLNPPFNFLLLSPLPSNTFYILCANYYTFFQLLRESLFGFCFHNYTKPKPQTFY